MFGIDNFINGQTLQTLANSVRLMFESIAIQAQTQWFKQHKGDGAHGAVTAESLASTSVVTASLSAGRLRAGSPGGTMYALLPNTSFDVVNWVPQSAFDGQVWGPHISVLYVVSQSGVGGFTLDSLDATGRESGDLLFLVAGQDLDQPGPGVTQSLFLEVNGAGLMGNTFRFTRGVSGGGVVGCPAGNALLLIYFKFTRGALDGGAHPEAPVRIGPSNEVMSGWYVVRSF